MVGGSLMVILILVLVLVSVVGSGCDRIGSRSSTCGFGSFCLYGWFWVFFRSFSVFGLFSSSFPPLSPSFVYRPLSPFLLEFSFFIPWSHGVRLFWLSFRLFLVLLEEFFVRWKYRQLHVDSGQEGFGISCVVVLSFSWGLHDLIKLYSGSLGLCYHGWTLFSCDWSGVHRSISN